MLPISTTSFIFSKSYVKSMTSEKVFYRDKQQKKWIFQDKIKYCEITLSDTWDRLARKEEIGLITGKNPDGTTHHFKRKSSKGKFRKTPNFIKEICRNL